MGSKPGLNPKEEGPRDSVSKSQSMPWGSENGGSSGGATTRKEALLPPISTSAVISSAVNTETQSVLVSATSSSALSPNHADTDSTTACDNTCIVDIVVPAGKTGFFIDSSSRGSGLASYVCLILENCPVRDKICIGDEIMAVDGEDVSKLKGVHVSMLLRSKSKNAMRKITVIRDAGVLPEVDILKESPANAKKEEKEKIQKGDSKITGTTDADVAPTIDIFKESSANLEKIESEKEKREEKKATMEKQENIEVLVTEVISGKVEAANAEAAKADAARVEAAKVEAATVVAATAEAAKLEVARVEAARLEAIKVKAEAEAAKAEVDRVEAEAEAAKVEIARAEAEEKAAKVEGVRLEAEAKAAKAEAVRIEAANAKIEAAKVESTAYDEKEGDLIKNLKKIKVRKEKKEKVQKGDRNITVTRDADVLPAMEIFEGSSISLEKMMSEKEKKEEKKVRMEKRESIKALVTDVQPGKSFDELTTHYQGKEDILLNHLTKLKAKKDENDKIQKGDKQVDTKSLD